MIPTPYYIVEEEKLRRNLSLIRDVAERSGAEIILAFKAFALWKTFPIFREYISHTTASSPDEARLAFEEFGSPAHTYSPAYTERDFQEILRCSSHITFNSLSQFHRFAGRVTLVPSCRGRESSGLKEGGNKQPSPSLSGWVWNGSFGLRVNPEYSEIETELYNPCAPGSRFGILAEDLPSQLPTAIEGFHIHCHCESSAETFARTLQHIEAKFSPWFPQLKWINFGGGHLMTRAGYNVELLVSTLQGFHARYPHMRMILEPGSAFAWQTGDLVASVVDIVENHGIRTAILDVSFTCHMPDCLEMPYHPAITFDGCNIPLATSDTPSPSAPLSPSLAPSPSVATVPEAFPSGCPLSSVPSPSFPSSLAPSPSVAAVPEVSPSGCPLSPACDHPYRLGGNSCLSGDFMGTWLFPRELHIGDELTFLDMIHYTTVKTTTFNGIHHPSIAIRRTSGEVQLLREFTYQDYRNRMD